jgi:hypothetical protein
MPSLIYQDVINLGVSLPIMGGPRAFKNVSVQERMLVTTISFMAKFNIPTPLSLLS